MDDYLDSPMDAEDVFPCKGCGEVSPPDLPRVPVLVVPVPPCAAAVKAP